MKTFTDAAGRTWTLTLTLGTAMKVKAKLDIDLLQPEAGEADVTTRANLGWRATAPTLRECTAEFEMVWDPTDAGFTAIKTAFLTAGMIALKILDKAGGQGPDGDFAITSFSRNEALEEAITVSVTAKLAVFRSWV